MAVLTVPESLLTYLTFVGGLIASSLLPLSTLYLAGTFLTGLLPRTYKLTVDVYNLPLFHEWYLHVLFSLIYLAGLIHSITNLLG